MVVREYLVETFGFDDSHLRTLGMGKQAETNSDIGWGSVQVIFYPSGAVIPAEQATTGGHLIQYNLSTADSRFYSLST